MRKDMVAPPESKNINNEGSESNGTTPRFSASETPQYNGETPRFSDSETPRYNGGTPRFSDCETPRFSEDEFIDTVRPQSPFGLDR